MLKGKIMDRNQISKWLKNPAKMANKYSFHVVYFCTGCGIIEILGDEVQNLEKKEGKKGGT